MTVSDLVDKFGGLRPMSRALGGKDLTTSIFYWKKVDKIPSWRIDAVLRAAKECGLKVIREDLER